MTTLPSEPGFYWWRPYLDSAKWRMMRIEACGTYIGVSDVNGILYNKAKLETFELCSPTGEWVKIEEPK